MPQRIRIRLSGPPPSHPFQHSSGLRALFYGWLERSSGSVAQAVHDANQAKPFAISPLRADQPSDAECYFDVSLLADWLSAPMLDGLSTSSPQVRLGAQEYALTDWQMIRQADWEGLLDSDARARDFRFHILTPTAHHAPGLARKSVVTPSPELYFGSWLNRWNLCCEQAMPEELGEVVAEHMAVSAFSGGTELVRMGRDRSFIGFVGQVAFSVLSPETLPPDALRYLRALARFSTYCGTGVDTSRGMGQTQFLG